MTILIPNGVAQKMNSYYICIQPMFHISIKHMYLILSKKIFHVWRKGKMWIQLKCRRGIVELMDCNIYFFWCYREGEKGDWGPAGKELLTKKQRKRNSDKKRDILIAKKETWKRNHTKKSIVSHTSRLLTFQFHNVPLWFWYYDWGE